MYINNVLSLYLSTKKRVNRLLPPEIVSFVNYPHEINKTSITPLKLYNVNQFTPSVKYFY